jgi:hypothetical protein
MATRTYQHVYYEAIVRCSTPRVTIRDTAVYEVRYYLVACCLVQVRYEDLVVPATGSDAHLPEGNTSFLLASLFLTPPPPPPCTIRSRITQCRLFFYGERHHSDTQTLMATPSRLQMSTKLMWIDVRGCLLGAHSEPTRRLTNHH